MSKKKGVEMLILFFPEPKTQTSHLWPFFEKWLNWLIDYQSSGQLIFYQLINLISPWIISALLHMYIISAECGYKY